jgi:hypothetical protein
MTAKLRIFGRLYDDNRLVLRPCYTLDRLQSMHTTEPAMLYAELLDKDENVLVREPITARPYSEGSAFAVRGSVTLPEQAALLVITRVDASGLAPVELARLDVPSSAPAVQIEQSPSGAVDGSHRIAWTVDGDPQPVEYLIDYSHDDGSTWFPIGHRTTAFETSVDVDVMPGGDRCRVSVTATNGMRSRTVISEPFHVQRKPCSALIQQPIDGTTVSSGLLLKGNGWWLEESRVEIESLVWRSDVDGDLGKGSMLDVRLTPGRHCLTLSAGSGKRRGTKSVHIDVLDDIPPATTSELRLS